jgi:hypothetical protein
MPKTLFIFFSSSIPLVVMQIVTFYIFPAVYEIISIIVGLLVPVIIGIRLIRLQESVKNIKAIDLGDCPYGEKK